MNDKDKKEETINLNTPTLSIIAETPDGLEHEYYFSENTASGEIVAGSTSDLGIKLEPQERIKLIEIVDVVKTYWSEIEASANLKEGFKLRVKRNPKKTIKLLVKR